MKVFSFASALAIMASQVYALFDDVEQLTSDNWAEKIDSDGDHLWVVTFYADWCPYCQKFEPELSGAVKELGETDKRVKFGAVDVMEHRDLIAKYGVRRSPTIKVFGADKSTPTDYVGKRHTADLVSYCNDECTTLGYVGDITADAGLTKLDLDSEKGGDIEVAEVPETTGDLLKDDQIGELEVDEVDEGDIASLGELEVEAGLDEDKLANQLVGEDLEVHIGHDEGELHGETVPEKVLTPTEVPEPENLIPRNPGFVYNMEGIIGTIAGAHETRVKKLNKDHELDIAAFDDVLVDREIGIKKDYDSKLQNLKVERTEALKKNKLDWEKEKYDKNETHKQHLLSLDEEAAITIDSILFGHETQLDLEAVVGRLDRDWFSLDWGSLKRPLTGPVVEPGLQDVGK